MRVTGGGWRWVDWIGRLGVAALAGFVVLAPWLPVGAARHERLVLMAFSAGVYLAVFLFGSLLFGRGLQTRHGISFGEGWKRARGWIWRWHGMVLAALAMGAFDGALLYTVGGLLLGLDGSWGDFFVQGARDGAFFLLVWAPGGALVLCFMQAFGPEKNAA